MRDPNDKNIAFIKKQARIALIVARANGLSFEMDDLLAEGYIAYVRARHHYNRRRSESTFSTYLHAALVNTYKNLLRDFGRRARNLRTVPYEEEKHDQAAPAHEIELQELVDYYSSMLEHRLDKEVLREMVYPSDLTLTIAKMFFMRANHLVSRHVSVGALKHAKAPQVSNPEVIARSLHANVNTVKRSIQRIRKIIKNNINVKEN